MEPTAWFVELMGSRSPALEEVALAIAAHRGAGVAVDGALAELDDVAAGFSGGGAPELLRYLCGEQRFRGNTANYDDPANSMLDLVVQRRLGLPITLSIVMIAVGRRVGIDLVPVGLPGEFLVGERDDAAAFHNPFRGRTMGRRDVEALFGAIHGPTVRFDPSMLGEVSAVDVASRMLANLISDYGRANQRGSLAWVLQLRSLLPGAGAVEVRQLAGVLEATGRFWEAADAVDRLVDLQPERAQDHRRTASRLRARLN